MGATLPTCHVAQSESDACAGVSGRGTGYWIARRSWPYAGDRLFAGDGPFAGDRPLACEGKIAGGLAGLWGLGWSVWAAGTVSLLGRPKGIGFGSGCGIRPLGRTSSSSPNYLYVFRRPFSLLDNVIQMSFFPLFFSVPESLLHPNPVFCIDFVCEGLTLPDLEKFGSPTFRLPCQRCSA